MKLESKSDSSKSQLLQSIKIWPYSFLKDILLIWTVELEKEKNNCSPTGLFPF